MQKNALLIFIKNPIKGTAKTRLAATIGDDAALEVYQELLAYTRLITEASTADKHLFYNRFIDAEDAWDNTTFQKKLQIQGDLGAKMLAAFQQIFGEGYQKAVIIGSDCGDLTTDIIEQAFKALDTHEVVFGPAQDGGYYLLGMSELHNCIFQNKSWSTAILRKETVEELDALQISHTNLVELNDIDEYADLLDWRKRK